jgi:hypothetical protein
MTDALRELSCSNCGAPMHAQSVGGQQVVKCEYCGRSHVFAAAPEEHARGRSAYRVGEAVRVLWGSQWWPGRIEREVGPGAWEISYDGWGKDWNETVGVHRLARAAGDLDDDVEGPPSSSAAVQSSRFRAGQPVRVSWKGKWWDGRVVRVIAADAWEISYDGYATSWNEVVGPDRIADRGAPVPAIAVTTGGGSKVGVILGALVGVLLVCGVAAGVLFGASNSGFRSSNSSATPRGVPVNPATLVPGSPVQIFWHQGWFGGHVVRVERSGLVRVHYDGYADSWDESVPSSRLRAP